MHSLVSQTTTQISSLRRQWAILAARTYKCNAQAKNHKEQRRQVQTGKGLDKDIEKLSRKNNEGLKRPEQNRFIATLNWEQKILQSNMLRSQSTHHSIHKPSLLTIMMASRSKSRNNCQPIEKMKGTTTPRQIYIDIATNNKKQCKK